MNIEKAKEIRGYMNLRELEWLAEQAQKAKIIVEFGCFAGRSTRALADNCIDGARIYAVDPWNGQYFDNNGKMTNLFSRSDFKEFEMNLDDHLKSGRVIPYIDFSHNFPDLRDWADFIFIDGDHRYPQVQKDIMKAMYLAKEGAVIAGHDYGREDWPGVKRAVDEIFPLANVIETIWWINA